MTSKSAPLLLSFLGGVATALLAKIFLDRKQLPKESRTNGTINTYTRYPLIFLTPDPHSAAGATIEGNDLSLFYGDINELTTITNARKFLPKDVYGQLVRDAVVCCVDILCVRQTKTRKECLLVLRASEPVKSVWWLPGGRLLKGETFFAAASRTAKEETGLENVNPIQVLGVWNTFFPTSNWDTKTSKGTQTVNLIVLVELEGENVEVKLDATSEQYRWISLDPDEAAANSLDRYVLQALLRLHTWNPTYNTL